MGRRRWGSGCVSATSGTRPAASSRSVPKVEPKDPARTKSPASLPGLALNELPMSETAERERRGEHWPSLRSGDGQLRPASLWRWWMRWGRLGNDPQERRERFARIAPVGRTRHTEVVQEVGVRQRAAFGASRSSPWIYAPLDPKDRGRRPDQGASAYAVLSLPPAPENASAAFHLADTSNCAHLLALAFGCIAPRIAQPQKPRFL
jgi:hypothetical protein